MSAEDFCAYREHEIAAYAQEQVRAGHWSADEAHAQSVAEFDRLLPQGLASPDHWLFTIRSPVEALVVGHLWLGVAVRDGQRLAFIYDLVVAPAHQRQGHAQRAMLAAEEQAQLRGLDCMALHVFGHNTSAKALYERLGYQATSIQMRKPLRDGRTPP